MDLENFKQILAFTNTEKELISIINIQPDAFLPFLLSLRDGGDYSYSAEDLKTIAVMDKTTIYDDKKKLGYSLLNFYFFLRAFCIRAEKVCKEDFIFFFQYFFDIFHII
jgi:predicted metalloprotease